MNEGGAAEDPEGAFGRPAGPGTGFTGPGGLKASDGETGMPVRPIGGVKNSDTEGDEIPGFRYGFRGRSGMKPLKDTEC